MIFHDGVPAQICTRGARPNSSGQRKLQFTAEGRRPEKDDVIGLMQTGSVLAARQDVQWGNGGFRQQQTSTSAGDGSRTSTCLIAALRPNVVQSVVQGAMHRLIWSGTKDYAVEHLV
jgi:hypothetical protein